MTENENKELSRESVIDVVKDFQAEIGKNITDIKKTQSEYIERQNKLKQEVQDLADQYVCKDKVSEQFTKNNDVINTLNKTLEDLQKKFNEVDNAMQTGAFDKVYDEKKLDQEDLQIFTKAIEMIVDPESGVDKVDYNNFFNKEIKASNATIGTQGGFLTRPTMFLGQLITQEVQRTAEVSQLLGSINIGQADKVEMVAMQQLGRLTKNNYTGTLGDVPKTDMETFHLKTIESHDTGGYIPISADFTRKSIIGFRELVSSGIARRIALTEDYECINGDGIKSPRGILTYPAGTDPNTQIERVSSGVNGGIGDTPDKIIKTIYGLKEPYRRNCSILVHHELLAEIAIFANKSNQAGYLNIPNSTTSRLAIAGVPVYSSPDLPKPAVGSESIILGDFRSGYRSIAPRNLSVRFENRGFTAGFQRQIYAFFDSRIGGDVNVNEALRIIKLEA